ncbi:hypothetical protein ACQEU8_32550 [Streptomyces sp. CA-250714]|uniref:hypothetical protein n=1 Tax=Streptomyces sp. CA-250714 TaxID=3240060 RepID=UPI003D8CB79D
MSFENEWEQHKQNGGSPGIQLNQATTPDLGPGGGRRMDGSGWLVVKDEELGKIGHAAFSLYQGLKKDADIENAGDKAAITRAAAHLSAHSFLLGKALGRTAEVWGSQLKTVLQGCAHISNHLDYSKSSQKVEDRKIGAQILGKDGTALPPSKISRLLD